MDAVANCQRAVAGALAMIANVQPEDLARPTPCAEWDVRALVNHMIGVCLGFNAALREKPLDPDKRDADLVGDKPAAAYAVASAAMMGAWQAPGALERTLQMPFGEMPAARAAQIVVGDQSIHTWDLATALGRPYAMPDDLADGVLEFMQQFGGSVTRGPTTFREPVACPPDASTQDRLLALAGRQP
jgi:uncharacterized protein (TIGR03086 family)